MTKIPVFLTISSFQSIGTRVAISSGESAGEAPGTQTRLQTPEHEGRTDKLDYKLKKRRLYYGTFKKNKPNLAARHFQ